jgi:hypothetical protein
MDGVHWKSGNWGFRCQEFGHISIRETPNLNKGKGRGHESTVTWFRAHSRGYRVKVAHREIGKSGIQPTRALPVSKPR